MKKAMKCAAFVCALVLGLGALSSCSKSTDSVTDTLAKAVTNSVSGSSKFNSSTYKGSITKNSIKTEGTLSFNGDGSWSYVSGGTNTSTNQAIPGQSISGKKYSVNGSTVILFTSDTDGVQATYNSSSDTFTLETTTGTLVLNKQ